MLKSLKALGLTGPTGAATSGPNFAMLVQGEEQSIEHSCSQSFRVKMSISQPQLVSILEWATLIDILACVIGTTNSFEIKVLKPSESY